MPGAWKEAFQSEFGTLAGQTAHRAVRSRLAAHFHRGNFPASRAQHQRGIGSEGFSNEMIHSFLPAFLENSADGELKSRAACLEFVLKMMSEGDASLPARGMGAISHAACREVSG